MEGSPSTARNEDLAFSRHGQLAEAFEVMARGLGPFIDELMRNYFGKESSWTEAASNRMGRPAEHGAADPLFQLLVLRRFWGPVFSPFYHQDLRKIIGQLVEARNLWAHFNLPEDTDYLDRVLLAVERLVAPVNPDAVSTLRAVRSRLKNPQLATDRTNPPQNVDSIKLESQLVETECAFSDLQEAFSSLSDELKASRKAAADKQLQLSATQNRLVMANTQAAQLQSHIVSGRGTRDRVEWLFVGLIAVMLLVMVLIAR